MLYPAPSSPTPPLPSSSKATHIGSAAAMTPDDIVYAQYREAGVLLHRGYTMKQMMDQCFGT